MYAERYRAQWLGKIQEAGVRRRAEFYYQQFDALRLLRQEVRRELLAEAQKHNANYLAQRGGLEDKKTSIHRRTVFFLTPFIELIKS